MARGHSITVHYLNLRAGCFLLLGFEIEASSRLLRAQTLASRTVYAPRGSHLCVLVLDW